LTICIFFVILIDSKFKTKMKNHYLYYVLLPSLLFLGFLAFADVAQTNYPSPNISSPGHPSNTSTPSGSVQEPVNEKPKSAPPVSKPATRTADSLKPFTSERTETGAKKRPSQIVTKDGQTYPLLTYKTFIAPNDPYANQWWVASNGMQQVWDIPLGSRATKIAIIDTGFALAHQDLSNRWAVNSGEYGSTTSEGISIKNCTDRGLTLNLSCNVIDDDFDGIVDNEFGATSYQNRSFLNCSDQGVALNKNCNRLDDDGNGYIDDYRGFDFVNYDSSAQAGETNPDGDGTTHGTMVAGVLGASGNNNVGLAGVNWYSSILPIQALDDDSYGDTYTVSEAIRYAADQGSDVISISLGTSYPDPYLRLAIQYAMNKGSIIVAASGNDGCDCISYPANYPEVLAVGAINSTGNPAYFSNYGRNLDLLAPGQSISSSSWAKTNQNAAYAGSIAGTSFSTPFVSGLLGLARSYQPDATWEEITGAMLENTDRRSLTSSIPRSNDLGYGVARANTMLARLQTPAAPSIRYQFSPLFIGSTRTYQCENTLPATLIYELTKPGQLRYTASDYEQYKAATGGWNSRELMYSCIGLPTDAPSIIRSLDLAREITNTAYRP
jgi:hypothetical protein